MTRTRRDAADETPFGKWMRGNPRLDSDRYVHGIGATDIDMIIHKYKRDYDRVGCVVGQRLVQHMMCIEVKTFGAEPSDSQTDTLRLFNAALLNLSVERQQDRRLPRTCRVKKCVNLWNEKVDLKMWGFHLLQLSDAEPIHSEMRWNRNWRISVYELECLIRFELNPWTLKELSDRRHHKYAEGKWTS